MNSEDRNTRILQIVTKVLPFIAFFFIFCFLAAAECVEIELSRKK